MAQAVAAAATAAAGLERAQAAVVVGVAVVGLEGFAQLCEAEKETEGMVGAAGAMVGARTAEAVEWQPAALVAAATAAFAARGRVLAAVGEEEVVLAAGGTVAVEAEPW